jgi:serine/threonine protein phosphatase PrpC
MCTRRTAVSRTSGFRVGNLRACVDVLFCVCVSGPPPAQSVEEIQSRLSAKFHSMNAKPAGVRGSALDKLFNLQHIDLETAKAVLSKPVDKSAVGAVDAVRENTHLGIVCGVAEEQGKRDYMEDRSTCLASIAGVVPEWPAHLPPTCFFGVFDGHGSMHGLVGYEVAEYLRTHLAKRLFAALAPLAQEYLRVGQACKFCAACGGLAAQEGCDHLFDVAKRYADTPPPSTPTAHAIPLRSPGMSPALNALPAVTQSAAQYYARPDFSVLVRDVFLEFDKEVLAQNFVKSAGSTCTIATIFGDALVLANVGDSDAYLCRDGIARRLTVHHKAIDPQESKRIWQSGGVVLGDRVSGMLEVRVARAWLSVFRCHSVISVSSCVSGSMFLAAVP